MQCFNKYLKGKWLLLKIVLYRNFLHFYFLKVFFFFLRIASKCLTDSVPVNIVTGIPVWFVSLRITYKKYKQHSSLSYMFIDIFLLESLLLINKLCSKLIA